MTKKNRQMRKFKHKATGRIVKKHSESFYNWEGYIVPNFMIENGDDWEEITEPKKSYEILKISYDNETGSIYVSQRFVDFPCKDIKFNIVSVKRLSDGEIFTVGDRVRLPNSRWENVNTKIKSIKLDHVGKVVFTIIDNDSKKQVDYPMFESFQHVSKPLFVTEDGKEIYEGDKYYILYTQEYTTDSSGNYAWSIEELTAYKGINYKHCIEHGILRFSTEKAADEYILMNKPCLSINDVLKAKTNWLYNSENIEDTFKQLVKSKL
jgi:hypothetical protein